MSSSNRNPAGWLPELLGPVNIEAGGTPVSRRRGGLNFIGATVEDDPDNDRLNITVADEDIDTDSTTVLQAHAQLSTSTATPQAVTFVGDIVGTFTLANRSTIVVDVEATATQAGGAKKKTFNVRREFLVSAGGSVTDGTQVNVIGPTELGGTLGASVSITRTGTSGRVEVTGVAGVSITWRLDIQVKTVTAGAAAAAPTVSSISPPNGPDNTATAVTIDGSNFVSGATVTINGFACTGVSFVNSGQLTALTPTLDPGGPYDVVVTNPDAQTGTLEAAYTYDVGFDIDALAWTVALEAPYAGDPWEGETTAGSSASRDFVAGVAPSPGAPINGHAPADFVPGSATRLVNSSNLADILGSNEFTVCVLANMDALAADGVAYDEPAFLADLGGYFSCSVTTSGARVYVFDGGIKTSNRTSVSTGTLTALFFKRQGGNLYARNGSGAWTVGVPSGFPSSVTNTLIMGRNYATGHIDGKVAGLRVIDSALNDSQISGIISAWETKFGVTL